MADQSIEQPQNQQPSESARKAVPEPSSEQEAQRSGEAAVVSDGPDESSDGTPLPYPTVAIGASAGGVEAYLELFSHLPVDTGMAFVIISHLSADHKSHLVDILGRSTSMPVEDIVDGARALPNHLYVLPPGVQARFEKGSFRLEGRPAEPNVHPIDYFFRSLASDQKGRALGVVLSGGDSDGALGLKAIKGEGGINMVQSPETAQFPDMPRNSISADHVDRILPPAQLAAELAQLARQYLEPVTDALDGHGELGEEQNFTRILQMMRGVSGIDFRLYKQNTIRRRVGRRMLLHRLHTFAEYAAFLQGNGKELRELQEDALINVTRFFRDTHVFDSLKDVILPKLFADRQPDQQVRFWVAGCSTGEEAYSIAICLLEYLSGKPFEPPIQIFGTDASDQNIQRARLGIYPESITGEVSPERLRRFFIKVDRGFQVSKRVRDLCIFARQNLCNDPPFSKMDMISCRNVLIYLGTDLQRQVLPTFHHALRQHGYLLLGATETIREFTELFQLVDRRNKFFAKVGTSAMRLVVNSPSRVDLTPADPQSTILPLSDSWGDVELQRTADRILLARYGPPGVVVDERLEILQTRGHTGPYLEMPPGTATLLLSRMLRDWIAAPVNDAVRRAIEQDAPVRVTGLRAGEGEEEHNVIVEVLPIHTVAPRSRCFLVLFLEQPEAFPSPLETREEPAAGSAEAEALIPRLRQDLTSTKIYLQTLLEERDARNQELVSANEEIQSSNEELQSTNEELETTKEELQSSNEELQTVNDELQQRNAVLTQTTNDLSNLLTSVNLPVLMLSSERLIRHFTPPTQRLMNLRPSDVGRPFGDIRLNLQVDDLQPLFSEVLETLAPREIEVQDRDGHWHLLRVRPYRTVDNKIDGIVLVLLDIDHLRKNQHELREARDFAQSVMDNMPLPLAVADLNLRIRATNDAFRWLPGLGNQSLQNRPLLDVAVGAWGLDEPLRSNLEALRSSPNTGMSFEFEHCIGGENPHTFEVRGRVVKPDSQIFLLVTVQDITEQIKAAHLVSEERDRLAQQIELTAQELGRTQEDLRALAGSLFTSQEDERRRVARELHDDICQKLAALEIETQQVAKLLIDKPEEGFRDLEQVRGGIASLADEVRRISHTLHPSVIDDLGLVPALRALVEDFRDRESMIATFSAQQVPEEIPRAVATGLYRIAQEALRNVAKHAGKTHVKVILRGTRSDLRLQVIDSGEGFDTQARRSGLGLISMEERARMMEGQFVVESELGEGTKITVQVAWPPPPSNRKE
jgi:two-component system CheB/CheR fusion protein